MSQRRGACPSLSTPMQTGDGLLVRLSPAQPDLSPAALLALATAAQRFGNGILEVSRRGSLQVRGLTEESVKGFARAVADSGLDADRGLPVDIPPLAGLDPAEVADARPVADRIRQGGRVPGLGPKVSVVLDGGGRLHLGGLGADVHLSAVSRNEQIRWRLAFGGRLDAPPLAVREQDVAELVLHILASIAKLGPQARAKDIDIHALRAEVADRLIDGDDGVPRRARPEPVGVHPLRDGSVAVGIGLPFGKMRSDALAAFAETAAASAAKFVRLAPGGALLAVGLAARDAAALQSAARDIGLVVEPSDPRRSIAACAGAGSCASGVLATLRLAAALAAEHAELLDGSLMLHLSGCEKGCAHPGRAEIVLVGMDAGCGLVVGGAARDRADATVPSLAAARGFRALAEVVRAARLCGETTAACLERLGKGPVAAAFEACALHDHV